MPKRSVEKRLPDLPPSEDKFWSGSVGIKEVKQQNCRHHFEVFDREIKCVRCGVGYYINADDEVKDGHLYSNGELVI